MLRRVPGSLGLALCLGLGGCGGNGPRAVPPPAAPPPVPAALAAALAAGDVPGAHAASRAFLAGHASAGHDQRRRVAALRALVDAWRDAGYLVGPRPYLLELRGLRPADAAIRRDLARLDAASRAPGKPGATPPGPAPPGGPDAARDAGAGGRPAPPGAAGGPAAPAWEAAAARLARALDTGAVTPALRAEVAAFPWRERRPWLAARLAWLDSGPPDPLGARFRALREAPAGSRGARLDLLAALPRPPLPAAGRTPTGRPKARLKDRDPDSNRRHADGAARVLAISWPGLPYDYLRASLDAGHFPMLAAMRDAGAFYPLGPGGPPPAPPAATGACLTGAGTRAGGAPYAPPAARRPPALGPGGEAARRARLFPGGEPPGFPDPAERGLLAFDLEVARRVHAAASCFEDRRPGVSWLELPDLSPWTRRLVPLLRDCRPPPGLAREVAAPLAAYGGVYDALVERVEVLLRRALPRLDRDDHVVVIGPGGPGDAPGFLLAWGPGVRVPAPGEGPLRWAPGSLGATLGYLAAGRQGAVPPGADSWLRPTPRSPFLAAARAGF